MLTYKETHSLEDRRKQVEKCKADNTSQIRVAVVAGKGETRLEFKAGFTIPRNWTMVDLAKKFRKTLNLNQSENLFFLVGGEKILVTSSSTIGELHQEYKDKDDDVLYINYYGIPSDKLY